MHATKNKMISVAVVGLGILLGTAFGAAPTSVAIGGYLSDEQGKPLDGLHAFRIELLAASGEVAVDTFDTTDTLVAGTFNLKVPLSSRLLDQETIRYRLWADVDGNGLKEDDRFPDTFTVSAVARGHEVPPLDRLPKAFPLFHSAGYVVHSDGIPYMHVGALEVPAPGVRFNTITYKAATSADPFFQMMDETHYEIGIYAPDGELAVKTRQPLRLAKRVEQFVQVVVPETTLESGQHYTAFTSDMTGTTADDEITYHITAQPIQGVYTPSSDYISISAPGAVLPPRIPYIRSARTRSPGPTLALEYLPEAADLPIGTYRRNDDPSFQWVLPAEKSIY